VEIRDALPEEAASACEVIRRSISDLCGADHLNDPLILGRWLANETPAIVAFWISRPGNSVLVAVENGTILAVGIEQAKADWKAGRFDTVPGDAEAFIPLHDEDMVVSYP